jgi:hypothetical protein
VHTVSQALRRAASGAALLSGQSAAVSDAGALEPALAAAPLGAAANRDASPWLRNTA